MRERQQMSDPEFDALAGRAAMFKDKECSELTEPERKMRLALGQAASVRWDAERHRKPIGIREFLIGAILLMMVVPLAYIEGKGSNELKDELRACRPTTASRRWVLQRASRRLKLAMSPSYSVTLKSVSSLSTSCSAMYLAITSSVTLPLVATKYPRAHR